MIYNDKTACQSQRSERQGVDGTNNKNKFPKLGISVPTHPKNTCRSNKSNTAHYHNRRIQLEHMYKINNW